MSARRLAALLAGVAAAFAGPGVLSHAAFSDAPQKTNTFEAAGWFTPQLSSVPDVLGSARQGSTLTAGATSFLRHPPTAPDTYAWQRCDAAAMVCTTVGTSSSYVIVAADVLSYLRLVVTSTRGAAPPLVATSNLTPVVQDTGAGLRPTNTASPVISGTTTAGSTLTVSTGTWTGVTNGYDLQWLRCDANGRAPCLAVGVNASTYVLTAADVGARMRAQVTGKTIVNGNAAATTVDTSKVD